VSDRRPVDPDPIPVSEIQELLAREVGPIVYDDGVGHTKSIDDVQEKLDGFLGAGLDDRFCLNPLGELVHYDKKVGKAARDFFERPDHVETPDHERPGEGDGLKRLRWQMGLSGVELAPLQCGRPPLHRVMQSASKNPKERPFQPVIAGRMVPADAS
jgi:hypothetical protein